MIRLLIKGRRFEALLAAAEREILIEDIQTVNTRFEEVSAITHAPLEKVQAWFREVSETGPYPPGTLLHYTEAGKP